MRQRRRNTRPLNEQEEEEEGEEEEEKEEEEKKKKKKGQEGGEGRGEGWCGGPWWAVDCRSVALLRVAMALITLADLYRRWGDLEAFATDNGVVPPGDTPHKAALHRVLFFRGPLLWPHRALAVLHALVAAAQLVGFRSRLACAANWLLTAAMHGRNEYIIDCGDRLQRNILFWLMQLDSGRCLSWDASRARGHPAVPSPPQSSNSSGSNRATNKSLDTSIAGLGLLVLLVALYWCALARRLPGHMWYGTLEATYYAMHNPAMARPLAVALGRVPELCAAMTLAVNVFELVGPALIAVSARWPRVRCATILGFMCMQAGFGFGLRLETFPWCSVSIVAVFLPAEFWRWLGSSRLVARVGGPRMRRELLLGADEARGAAAPEDDRGPSAARLRRLSVRDAVAAFFVAYVAVLNLGDLGLVSKPDNGDLGELLRINQWWVMFSPDPSTVGRWTTIEGTLGSGERVDLLRGLRDGFAGGSGVESAPRRREPGEPAGGGAALPSDAYPSFRWQKYVDEAVREHRSARVAHMARYICRKWASARASAGPGGGDGRSMELREVEILDWTEEIPPPRYASWWPWHKTASIPAGPAKTTLPNLRLVHSELCESGP